MGLSVSPLSLTHFLTLSLTLSLSLPPLPPGECVPVGCMVINSVARLRQLVQPTSHFSLPNAPTLADLDWEENGTDAGK